MDGNREASAAGRLRPNALTVQVKYFLTSPVTRTYQRWRYFSSKETAGCLISTQDYVFELAAPSGRSQKTAVPTPTV